MKNTRDTLRSRVSDSLSVVEDICELNLAVGVVMQDDVIGP
jgi:hypothetical protein